MPFDPFNPPDLVPEVPRRITEPKQRPIPTVEQDIGSDEARGVFNKFASEVYITFINIKKCVLKCQTKVYE